MLHATRMATRMKARQILQSPTLCLKCRVRASIRLSSNSTKAQRAAKPSTESFKPLPYSDIRQQLRYWAEQQVAKITAPILYENAIGNNLVRPEDAMSAPALSNDDESGLDPTLNLDESPNLDNLGSEYEQFDYISRKSLEEIAQLASNQEVLLSPGDLIEYASSFLDPHLLVFVGLSERMEYVFIDGYGKVYSYTRLQVLFHLPSCVPPAKVQPLKSALLESGVLDDGVFRDAAPRQLAQPVIQSIRLFKEKAHRVQQLLEPSLAVAHQLVAHPTRTSYLPLKTIVEAVIAHANQDLDPASPNVVMAVTNTLFRRDFGFAPLSRYSFAFEPAVVVYSAQLAKSLRKVETAVRDYNEGAALLAAGSNVPSNLKKSADYVRQFARTFNLIAGQNMSGTSKTLDGSLVSTEAASKPNHLSSPSTPHTFSENDLDFIRVLRLIALDWEFKAHPTLRAFPPGLLRILGILETSATNHVVRLSARNALISIGVLSPYSLSTALESGIRPLSDKEAQELENVNELIDRGEAPEETVPNFEDSLQHLRKDWGDLPVYCIDKSSTTSIDDGISFEPVPDSSGEVWIHCHFAHVSAYAPPSSLIGKTAAHNQDSSYFLTKVNFMLPNWVTQYFSIAPNKPVLTVSVKIDSKGNILHTDVQPGIVRNVISLSNDSVNRLLGQQVKSWQHPPNKFAVGPPLQQVGQTSQMRNLTPAFEQLEPLKNLLQTADKLSGILYIGRDVGRKLETRHVVEVEHPSRVVVARDDVQNHPQFTPDVPTISAFARPLYDSSSFAIETKPPPSTRIVDHLMTLAGVAAAQWCATRSIPMVYSGSQTYANGFEQALNAVQAQRLDLGTERVVRSRLIQNFTNAVLSSEPIRHHILGTSEFTQLSNPLRMYQHLVNHWQIDAVLRKEAELGRKVSQTDGHSFLPFQRADINEIIQVSKPLQIMHKRQARHELQTWVYQLFARAFHFDEISLPDPMLCMIGYTPCRGNLVDIPIACEIEGLPEDEAGSAKQGELWEVKIKELRILGTMIVTAIRRVREASGTWLDDYKGYVHKPLDLQAHPSPTTREFRK